MSGESKLEKPGEEKLSKEQLSLRIQALEKMREILDSRDKIDAAVERQGNATRKNYVVTKEDKWADKGVCTLSELDDINPSIFNEEGALISENYKNKVNFIRLHSTRDNHHSNREAILFIAVGDEAASAVVWEKGGMFYEKRKSTDPDSTEGIQLSKRLWNYSEDLKKFLKDISSQLKLKPPVNTSYELSEESRQALQGILEDLRKQEALNDAEILRRRQALHDAMEKILKEEILDDPIYKNPTDLIKRIKPKKLHHGEWTDPVMKGLFIGGSTVMLLQVVNEAMEVFKGVVQVIPVISEIAPWIYFAWNAIDALASLCAEQSEDARIARAKTHIGKKEMFQGVSRLGSGILLTTNVVTGSTSSVFGIGMSPLLTAAFLPLAGFGFALTMWISAARAYSGYLTAEKKCDPHYLLRDRLKKAKFLKAEINRLEEIIDSAGFSAEEHAQTRKKLHKYNRDLMRLELQHIALAKQVIAGDKVDKAKKAAELAAQLAEYGYTNISVDNLQQRSVGEVQLAKRLLDKQHAKKNERLVDVVAWVLAAIGMTLAAFAIVFLHIEVILGILAMIFLVVACGIKSYQLYQKRSVALMLNISDEASRQEDLLAVAWDNCQREIADEQIARLYAAITPEDIAVAKQDPQFKEVAHDDLLLKAELLQGFRSQIEDYSENAIRKGPSDEFCQAIQHMSPRERDRYLQHAVEVYAERGVIKLVGREFVEGLSAGDRKRIVTDNAKTKSPESMAAAQVGFWSKVGNMANQLIPKPRPIRDALHQHGMGDTEEMEEVSFTDEFGNRKLILSPVDPPRFRKNSPPPKVSCDSTDTTPAGSPVGTPEDSLSTLLDGVDKDEVLNFDPYDAKGLDKK